MAFSAQIGACAPAQSQPIRRGLPGRELPDAPTPPFRFHHSARAAETFATSDGPQDANAARSDGRNRLVDGANGGEELEGLADEVAGGVFREEGCCKGPTGGLFRDFKADDDAPTASGLFNVGGAEATFAAGVLKMPVTTVTLEFGVACVFREKGMALPFTVLAVALVGGRCREELSPCRPARTAARELPRLPVGVQPPTPRHALLLAAHGGAGSAPLPAGPLPPILRPESNILGTLAVSNSNGTVRILLRRMQCKSACDQEPCGEANGRAGAHSFNGTFMLASKAHARQHRT